ncbi:hypothetical protein Trydic_g18655 [Trypoxylus dichotomus]
MSISLSGHCSTAGVTDRKRGAVENANSIAVAAFHSLPHRPYRRKSISLSVGSISDSQKVPPSNLLHHPNFLESLASSIQAFAKRLFYDETHYPDTLLT